MRVIWEKRFLVPAFLGLAVGAALGLGIGVLMQNGKATSTPGTASTTPVDNARTRVEEDSQERPAGESPSLPDEPRKKALSIPLGNGWVLVSVEPADGREVTQEEVDEVTRKYMELMSRFPRRRRVPLRAQAAELEELRRFLQKKEEDKAAGE